MKMVLLLVVLYGMKSVKKKDSAIKADIVSGTKKKFRLTFKMNEHLSRNPNKEEKLWSEK